MDSIVSLRLMFDKVVAHSSTTNKLSDKIWMNPNRVARTASSVVADYDAKHECVLSVQVKFN